MSALAWNTHRHLELFYGIPGIGAVLHTADPRLSDEQLAYTLNHAESRILLFDRNLLAAVERLMPRLETVGIFVMMCCPGVHTPGKTGALYYKDLIAPESVQHQWAVFGKNTASFLCYTSGTTGDPKRVLYSHKAVVRRAQKSLPTAV